jgi:hypothetical protein
MSQRRSLAVIPPDSQCSILDGIELVNFIFDLELPRGILHCDPFSVMSQNVMNSLYFFPC